MVETVNISGKISSEIVASGSQIVFNIQFAKAGNFTIERRIGNGEWVEEKHIHMQDYNNKPNFEKTISGLVAGQKIRFKFSDKAQVTSLTILQS